MNSSTPSTRGRRLERPALFDPPASAELREVLDRFADLVRAHESFVVVSHACPDGDATGSTLAMGLLLEALGKKVTFFNRDPIPYNFAFLPGAQTWRTQITEPDRPQVTIVLDCGSPEALGLAPQWSGWGSEAIVVLDHHKRVDAEFASLYVRELSAAATGEIVYRALVTLGAELSVEIATCLYCCVLTDTGSFRYASATPTSFRIAGQLVEAGVDPWTMTSHIYESQPVARIELLARALSTLSLSASGKLATIRIERDALLSARADLSLTDGFINYARGIDGVEVAAQLIEITEGWRVSFRSRGGVDVSRLAKEFGGGGSRFGAGCVMTGSHAEVEQALADALEEILSHH